MPPRAQAAAGASVLALGLALSLVLGLALGCDGATGPGAAGGKAYRDGLGREVRVRVPARRVVSLAPSNTELLFAAGAGSSLAGRDDNSDHPPEALRAPALGTTAGRLNVESMLALKPDLVLAAWINSPERIQSLEPLGLTVFLLQNPRTFPELFTSLRLVGELTGHGAEADRAAAGLEARVEAVLEKARRAAGRPRVFYELDSTDPSRPWSAGPGTFIDMLIRLAGGENFCRTFAEEFPRVSAETVLRGDPDVIVLGDARYGVTVESVGRRGGWEVLTAVREGRVHAFDDDLVSRPGPRLVEGLERLAGLLHPELFGQAAPGDAEGERR
ncbi:MAG: cobalamin-binding protein [Planctomycetes bacterium]|nr:cobalamin-binding protein [Planctomycetota bacterium]